jgi:hypothetical protein
MFQIISTMDQSSTNTAAKCAIFLNPIDVDSSESSSSEGLDDNNYSIFREMDCEYEGDRSSPIVLRANPISEGCDGLRVISPYPYCQSEQETNEQNELPIVLCNEWAIDEETMIDVQPIENFSASRDEASSSIYSFYFEATPIDDEHCDDFSLSSHGSDAFDDEDCCLETISDDPASFWESGLEPTTEERPIYSTQISLESGSRHRTAAGWSEAFAPTAR